MNSIPSQPTEPDPKPNTALDKYAHLLKETGVKPQRTVTPRTRILLYAVLGLFSLLLANGLYLSGVTFSEWYFRRTFQDLFYHYMFLVHLVLGLVLILPFLAFGFYHWRASYQRRNRRAVRIGYALLICGVIVLVSGILLIKFGSFEFMRGEMGKRIVYWSHLLAPLVAMWLYWLHRLVGTRVRWVIAGRVGLATALAVGAMLIVQTQDPRKWNKRAPADGQKYFENSLASTRDGNFIPQRALMNDDYCKKCHADVYNDWFHSAHHFSSFNNPAYLYAVRETRKVSMENDGNVHAARFCAGCHDPVPFFSGAFDNPHYDDVNDPTSQAGITCTVCHAITEIESTRGNADYIIEEPQHYPFAYSDNPILQQVNQLLVKAKPAFHKSEMLKPVHKSAEFCSTCHKVHLPYNLTKYKEWVRGQNHYDSYLLSGVAGHGARSFYYPEKAQTDCNGCHMPYRESDDIAARPHPETQKPVVHNHFFPGGNTALPYWRNEPEYVALSQAILKDCARVDLFGVRREGTIDGELIAPLRPHVPALDAGENYLLEAVIRTLKVGHHLTQGTVDSNELWLEVKATSGDRVIGVSGGLAEDGSVDEWSHFVNNFMIDRHGNRIARRNAQDIFIALYDHQIPPGAGQTAHYRLEVPEDIAAPVEVTVKLNYRKFDQQYIDFMNREYKEGDRDFYQRGHAVNTLPITVIAEDRLVFPVVTASGVRIEAGQESQKAIEPTWQRWNDYGIGLLLTGTAQLKQAAAAFEEVEQLQRFDGPLNLARVLFAEGNLDGATEALARAATMEPPPPSWTMAWLSGEVARQQGQFEVAAENLRGVLYDDNAERRNRKFDFSLDYVVRNLLGSTYLDLALSAQSREEPDEAKRFLNMARTEFQRVLSTDSENLMAHANLVTVFERLGDSEQAEVHRKANLKYKPDDNASNLARRPARQKYPAANKAAEAVVIYPLQRVGAPELPAEAARQSITQSVNSEPADPAPLASNPGGFDNPADASHPVSSSGIRSVTTDEAGPP
jgi:tetratricopeptide (TPR) repeat protein